MWRKELKLIDGLGKLYPKLGVEPSIVTEYKDYQETNFSKAAWIFDLCYYLNQRIPRLEYFIKLEGAHIWAWYKHYFKITEKQCGKES